MLTIHMKMDINFSWYYIIIINLAIIFFAFIMIFDRNIFHHMYL